MTDIGPLAQIVIDILAIGGILAVIKWLGQGEGGSLADPFAIPVDPPWPRGVQEEEPQPWRIERLGIRPAPAAAVERGLANPARAATAGAWARPSIAD